MAHGPRLLAGWPSPGSSICDLQKDRHILGDARRMGIDSADGKRGGQVALPRRLQIN